MGRRNFDVELGQLHVELLRMACLVRNAFLQMLERIESQEEVAMRAVVEGDRVVDEAEKAIEQHCLRLLMQQQPVVAADLRAVSTALKLITDLERIGDQAADIAEIGLVFYKEGRNPLAVPCCIGEMFALVCSMLEDAITAFADSNLPLAAEVERRDDMVDACFVRLKGELVNHIKAEQYRADDLLDLLMIGKYLERVADHATNVCEWVEFFQTGRLQDIQIL